MVNDHNPKLTYIKCPKLSPTLQNIKPILTTIQDLYKMPKTVFCITKFNEAVSIAKPYIDS